MTLQYMVRASVLPVTPLRQVLERHSFPTKKPGRSKVHLGRFRNGACENEQCALSQWTLSSSSGIGMDAVFLFEECRQFLPEYLPGRLGRPTPVVCAWQWYEARARGLGRDDP